MIIGSPPNGGTKNSEKVGKVTSKSLRRNEAHGQKVTPKQSGKYPMARQTKKKLNQLGSVYDQRSAVVPGSNGSVIHTSTQNLRQMNGYTSGSKVTSKSSQKRAQEIIASNK